MESWKAYGQGVRRKVVAYWIMVKSCNATAPNGFMLQIVYMYSFFQG